MESKKMTELWHKMELLRRADTSNMDGEIVMGLYLYKDPNRHRKYVVRLSIQTAFPSTITNTNANTRYFTLKGANRRFNGIMTTLNLVKSKHL